MIQTGEKSQERQEWRKDTKREPLHAIHLTQDLLLVGKRKLFSMREKKKENDSLTLVNSEKNEINEFARNVACDY